ncbi:hypothetical protein K435DRAFT_363145 [Dendrothele bispora CBS 962.96]|uniref:Uncharacterized protein n=1 Tax=Dendrothele bispora (strain CBS 962.96) TaxID=1314807 RepID=A0A4S8LCJ9_DENBC|nr:hypothetical protein K435DRAFT_363145 [Dendrothele bispora CBS 962.96]
MPLLRWEITTTKASPLSRERAKLNKCGQRITYQRKTNNPRPYLAMTSAPSATPAPVHTPNEDGAVPEARAIPAGTSIQDTNTAPSTITAPAPQTNTNVCSVTGMEIDPGVETPTRDATTSAEEPRRRKRMRVNNDWDEEDIHRRNTGATAPDINMSDSTHPHASSSTAAANTRTQNTSLPSFMRRSTATPVPDVPREDPVPNTTQTPPETETAVPLHLDNHHPAFNLHNTGLNVVNPDLNAYSPGVVATPPVGGYPNTHGFHMGNVQDGQEPQQVEMWNAVVAEQGGFLLRMFDPLPDPIATQQRMVQALQDALPGHTSPTVAPPERAPNHRGRGPLHFLVTDISPQAANHILQQRVIDTTHGTFIATEYRPNPTSFVTTIQGHTYREDQVLEATQAFRAQLRREPQVAHFLAIHHDAFPPHVSPTMAADIVIDTLWVRPIPMGQLSGTPRIYWNLYLTVPTRHIPYYNEWVTLIRSITFRTALYGAGRAIDSPFHCPRCAGIDHPAGHCPLPLVQGWIGPPANRSRPNSNSMSSLNEQQSQRGRNTSRGRGNQRGRGRGQKRGRGL